MWMFTCGAYKALRKVQGGNIMNVKFGQLRLILKKIKLINILLHVFIFASVTGVIEAKSHQPQIIAFCFSGQEVLLHFWLFENIT